MYVIIVWTGGRREGIPDVFGPFPDEATAVIAGEIAARRWKWHVTVTPMADGVDLLK